MAREGVDATFIYLPDSEEGAQWMKVQIEKVGRQAQSLALDVTKEENGKEIIDAHISKFGKLSVPINNAATGDVRGYSYHRTGRYGEDLPRKRPLNVRDDRY